MKGRQGGAALLLAMLTVTLVASLAASALWRQWRASEVEAAERARIQSAWLLVGALDWSRLILREDSLARSGDGSDNLTEPWAIPLAEARLSTFLAAQPGTAEVADASSDTSAAFLSGQINDQQALLNLRNLEQDGQPDASAQRQFARLFQYLGLPAQQLEQLTQAMVQALSRQGEAAPLLPRSVAQLTWWGLPAASVARLAPHVTLLPARTPVNLNTASALVLWASASGLSLAQAQQLVQAREARPFSSEADATKLLGEAAARSGISASTHSVASQYFEVRGRLRLQGHVVEERSLVLKQRGLARTLWRERGTPALASAAAADTGSGPYNAAPTRAP
ncbi:type II secretion system minor pseudopilin GspK [Melaminivora sp.]